MDKNYGSEDNSDFIFITVAEMVKCTDVEVMAFRKKNPSKKRESRASEEAEVVLEVEAIPIVPILMVAVAEVPNAPSEVLRNVEVIGELAEVHDAAGDHDAMDPPIGKRSPSWAAEAS